MSDKPDRCGVGEMLTLAVRTPVKHGIQQENWFGSSFQQPLAHQLHAFDPNGFLHSVDHFTQNALEALLHHHPGHILEVGSGSGDAALWLQAHGAQVTACETDPACATLCEERGVSNVVHSSFTHLAGTFDAVVLLGGGLPCLTPTEQVEEMLTTLINLLKERVSPHGCLLLDFYSYDSGYFKDSQGYMTATIRFISNTSISEFEYYIYPDRVLMAKLMQQLEFQQIYCDTKAVNIGSTDAFRTMSIWQRQ
ncbi:hypothetical protein GCM10008959_39500 [Deinococcus seoulensis]|uniref:Methyltransferase domain-containing protein n=1 Tax=Deinococcus seoulensis TaxID=1837379 RepID=A0ABQ2S0W6_9DEIO|nr:class I SAM-dependent methyltransferase [Deinococcus seoulensis]GGR74348.1 hypothetical protein GCM10008959_39500 [Deinococcus seoulensis]